MLSVRGRSAWNQGRFVQSVTGHSVTGHSLSPENSCSCSLASLIFIGVLLRTLAPLLLVSGPVPLERRGRGVAPLAEGSRAIFLVCTYHHNLEYLQSARRLNARQARWALFLIVLVFNSPTVPGQRTLSRTPSPGFLGLTHSLWSQIASCPGPVSWELSVARWSCAFCESSPAIHRRLPTKSSVCPTGPEISSDPLGSCLPAAVPPWHPEDSLSCLTEVLVALHEIQCPGVHGHVLHLRPQQRNQ